MFAPPPVQLSRAEIQTRLAGEAQNAERVESPDKGSENSSSNAASLHRNDSRSPIAPLVKRFTGKGGQRPFSPQSTEGRPSLQAPSVEGNASRKTSIEGVGRLPIGFGENPRPAPAPPTRPVPVPSEAWKPPVPGAFPQPSELVSDKADGNDSAPPIPPKSARRINAANVRAKALTKSTT